MAVDDSISTEKRFFAKAQKTDSCWNWTAYKNAAGYGTFYFGKKAGYAHRYAYLRFNGPLADGHEVDHICKNPSCVNPAHLRSLPIPENRRKGQRAEITACKNGHPYESVFVGKKKARVCRLCKNQRLSAWRKLRAASSLR